ncbi:MAG: tryptophan 7-halogenase [Flavobacteriales bacterium]|nr:tryptophan 7-halogenase [Flavobacteriales bacterium]
MKSDDTLFDIVIVGSGVSAAAAMLAIEPLPIESLSIEPAPQHTHPLSIGVIAPQNKKKEGVGESLSPSAQPILEKLGIWSLFLQEGHLSAQRSFSSWGTDQLIEKNMPPHLSKKGWCLNREKFNKFVWKQAEKTPHIRHLARLTTFKNTGTEWEMKLSDRRIINARFILDCSGRHAVVAKKLTTRHRKTKMVALYNTLSSIDKGVEPTPGVLLEASMNGWWYSNLLPNGKMIVYFFTDPDLLPTNILQDKGIWQHLVSTSQYTLKRIISAGFSIETAPNITNTGSSYAQQFTGENWAAAGDAVAVFDPLSSHGITTALWSGYEAGQVARSALNKDYDLMLDYECTFREGIQQYKRELQQFYRQEHRFLDSVFWRRGQ